jgi:hypothetical protein
MPHNGIVTTSPALSPAERAALSSFVADLTRIFGVRLVSAAAYGLWRHAGGVPLHVLVLVERLTFDDLAACARLASGWQRAGIGVPLLLEQAEFERTLDVFPIEYGEILADYLPLTGADALRRLQVAEADVRRAVEFHAKSLLIHLREGFLETGGSPPAVHALVAASVPALHALLTNLARLCGESGDDLPAMAERCIGIEASTVRDVLAAGAREASAAEDFTPLLVRYLEAAGRIWSHVDGWHAR